MEKYIKKVFSSGGSKKSSPGVLRQGSAVSSTGKRVALSRIVFDKYDVNGDGKISLDEFKKLVEDRGYAFSIEEAVAAFTKIDEDASGDIDYEEFLQFWKIEDRFEKLKLTDEEITKVQEIFNVFQYYDEGSKGALTKDEWNQLRKYMTQYGYDMSKLTYESIDKNGDGVIEFEEYLQLMIDTFHMIYDEDEK